MKASSGEWLDQGNAVGWSQGSPLESRSQRKSEPGHSGCVAAGAEPVDGWQ